MTGSFSFVNDRDAPPVSEQPAVRVTCWRAVEAANGNRHLLIVLDHGPIRITSSITSVDPATAALTTESGRRYELLGGPETRQQQRTLLTAYAQRAGLYEAIDVSDALWQLRACFDTEFWSTIPPIEGAIEACHALHDAGFTLVCVSALELRHEATRLRNLRMHGFPIERVVATGSVASTVSPKAAALAEMDPAAFVDDYLPYLRGLKTSIHTALVLRQPTGSPNVGPELAAVGSRHADLLAFSHWWLGPSRADDVDHD